MSVSNDRATAMWKLDEILAEYDRIVEKIPLDVRRSDPEADFVIRCEDYLDLRSAAQQLKGRIAAFERPLIDPTPPGEKERERLGDELGSIPLDQMPLDKMADWICARIDGGEMVIGQLALACLVRTFVDRVRLSLRQADAPVGWVSVPVEPTEAMLHALETQPEQWDGTKSWQDYQRACWAAVLAATPRPAGSTNK